MIITNKEIKKAEKRQKRKEKYLLKQKLKVISIIKNNYVKYRNAKFTMFISNFCLEKESLLIILNELQSEKELHYKIENAGIHEIVNIELLAINK